MPELPEVEVLVRHLAPRLAGSTVRTVKVHRGKIVAPTSDHEFQRVLRGARFCNIRRRGKYLMFEFKRARKGPPLFLLGHLGMTGRMYLQPLNAPLPKHAAVSLELNHGRFVFEDTRYFGRLTLSLTAVDRLGPEPLSKAFTAVAFQAALARSRQAIKVRLLDQCLVAGVGNIYASESLYRARIGPARPARSLSLVEVRKLRNAIQQVLSEAIRCGSTLPLNLDGTGRRDRKRDRLFYFGQIGSNSKYYEERLRVYDRLGRPCRRCGTAIRRIVQAARSTFYCPTCQPAKRTKIRTN